MRNAHGRKGQRGEALAAAFLEGIGYRVVDRNVRLPGGEIDLVCREAQTVVFVEVKVRSTQRYGSALRAVDAKKRATLRSIAADYMQIVAPGRAFRFDVIAIDGERIAHHRNAF